MDKSSPTLSFFGGAGTVTGSKYLIRMGRSQILLDAGLFQGLKQLRLRNWAKPPFNPSDLDAIALSHAHIDHSGYLPLLVREGFRGKIFCTSGTKDLLNVMLLDAAHLQEEEAEFANRHGCSKHKPALPLYTTEDAEKALGYLRSVEYHKPFQIAKGIAGSFWRAGHILGSAIVELQIGEGSPIKLVFSGDLGRWNQPMICDPEFVPEADILLVESTYGNRIHPPDPENEFVRVINETAQKGGVLLIPAFAVGRAQELIWMIRQFEEAKQIPELPVYVDSPMAINVSDIYCRHPEDHDLDMKTLMDEHKCPLCCKQYHLVRTPQESRKLNDLSGPMIIISASGMATGGRILHHLKLRLPDPKTTVLLAGFQAAGTRGRSLQEGAKRIRIHGAEVQVCAKVEILQGISAHADKEEILKWLSGFKKPPGSVYIVHGEPLGAEHLASEIKNRFGWQAKVALDQETVPLAR